jgi:hypothetical protein
LRGIGLASLAATRRSHVARAGAAAAVVLCPDRARFEIVLSRIPEAIFASLATATLLGGSLPAPPVPGAAIGALLASPARSLLPVLIGGAIGDAAGLF